MSFWRLSDGTEPSLRCDACREPTPITTHGLCPFCSDSDGSAELRDAASGSIGEADDSAGPKGIAQPVSTQSASLQEREGK